VSFQFHGPREWCRELARLVGDDPEPSAATAGAGKHGVRGEHVRLCVSFALQRPVEFAAFAQHHSVNAQGEVTARNTRPARPARVLASELGRTVATVPTVSERDFAADVRAAADLVRKLDPSSTSGKEPGEGAGVQVAAILELLRKVPQWRTMDRNTFTRELRAAHFDVVRAGSTHYLIREDREAGTGAAADFAAVIAASAASA
jgi:hypothetical protein